MSDERGLSPEDVTFQISGLNNPPVVIQTVEDHPIVQGFAHSESSLSHAQMPLESLPGGKSEGLTTLCSERCVTSESAIQMPLNRDKVNVYSSRHDDHHPTEECIPSLPTKVVGHRDSLGSDNTYGHMSTSKCCTMLADMATILERLNVLENSSDQCKDCLEQPLDVTDVSDSVHVESSARDNPDDLLCPDVDSDTDEELLMTDPLCTPTLQKNAPWKRRTRVRSAWDVTDDVDYSPSKQLLPQRGEEGECGWEEFDAGGDGNTMQQLASCQQEDDREFIDSSMAAETEEETSEVITNRVAWEVDITDLVARRGKKPRKSASSGNDTGSYAPIFTKFGLFALCRDNNDICFTK